MAKYKTPRIQAYGLTQALPVLPPQPIIAQRAPTVDDLGYEPGTVWVDQVGGSSYILISKSAGGAIWSTSVIGANLAVAGSVTAGTTITATAGDITADAGDIVATLGDITAAAGNIEATLGSITAGTTLIAGTSITSTLGDITATNGDVVLGTSGNTIRFTTGGAADMIGTATLALGTATVVNANVAATSIILCTHAALNASTAVGVIQVVPGVGTFDINALDATAGVEVGDLSDILYMIINPV